VPPFCGPRLQGGTTAAPRQLNNENREEPENYWASLDRCDYVVTLRDGDTYIDKLGGQLGGLRLATLQRQ
jgi:hypothetical protein